MDERQIAKRLMQARGTLVREHPFFGRLLLTLGFGLAECGTAFTDMSRIVFDPVFASELSSSELRAVLLHSCSTVCSSTVPELRASSVTYNVACDIVVNSTILEMLGQDELIIRGKPLMHKAPNGCEGRYHTAEEIYSMLMKSDPEEIEAAYPDLIDDHSVWEQLKEGMLEEIWEQRINNASRACGSGSGIPAGIARYLKETDRRAGANWRQLLHDFIRYDRGDFDFKRPDKRYMPDVYMPRYCDDMYGARLEKLWFLVDTSASVSDEAVAAAYREICQAIEQVDSLSGRISFFDCEVTEPIDFESIEDIMELKPIGGGGTDFGAIFNKLAQLDLEGNRPNLIVIITDGYCPFPSEEAALGVPVIWIIVDSDVEPPFGECAYITT